MSELQLRDTAEGLLDWVTAWYEQANVPLPLRGVVVPGAPGQIAWDCEQVTVALSTITTGSGTGQVNVTPQLGTNAGMGLIRYATWAVQVVRCSPTPDDEGNPPSVDQLDGAAQSSLTDAGLLSQAMIGLASQSPGSIDWLPIGGVVNAGQVGTLGPEGGFQAVEATLTLTAMELA